ncbi:MAG: FAD-dependent oxidoreductase [Sphingomonas sp.]|uniref:oxidoreductase n=1 Tax=Sphingomonas sp. TaxID=28214 RepID=UPI002272C553|nr:FAD-dependent oxidoreductase [Sphingomonas sp.]MCX8474639.1 FAD-dependent oxidoreductase [Sphingomonas sp.]
MNDRPTSAAFPRLFSPLAIGGHQLRNRIVMLPHGTSMVVRGAPTDDDIAYYTRRAAAGPGLMVTGASVTSLDSTRRGRKLIETFNDEALPMLARRAAAVRAEGAAIVGQIVHLGRESIGMESDWPLLAPSALRSPRDLLAPREMDETDIRRVVADFAACARNLEATGHDGVEIHGAHGYLVGQFLSPATNHRDDRWGGDPDRRLRFLVEVIEAIREACGRDFLLGLRLSADEEIADGLELPDTRRIVEALAARHPVDYLSVTLGARGSYVKDATQPKAGAARAAAILREASGLVTIAGQRFTSPGLAEAALESGQADAIGFARAFVADARWVAKAAADMPERIRPCIGLNQDCRAFAPHLHCAVNPRAGRESDPRFDDTASASSPKTVAVIGGGPAGLEAARTAAARGHRVTLYEASDGLGGQFLYAASIPGRGELSRLVDHLRDEAVQLGISIRLQHRVDSLDDLAEPADVVILATGAEPHPLPAHLDSRTAIGWLDILRDGAPAPGGSGHALVQDDGTGFWWTYGVANALADAGWRITVATPASAIAAAIPAESLMPLLVRLGGQDTQFRTLTTLLDVRDGEAQLADITSGAESVLACDLVVVQTGRRSIDLDGDRFAGVRLHRIGDCVAPRRLSNALFEARLAAADL